MPMLKLHLLGSPLITLNDQTLSIGRQKALALLFYLAVKGEPQRRDTLSTLLWPEQTQQQARQALSRHLFALKEALGDGWLVADQETLGLRAAPGLWLDVVQFRAYLAECAEAKATCRAALTTAVALYRDDFLRGFTLPDSPAFDDWQFFQGEELRQQFAAALAQLIQLLVDEEDDDAALPYARRWLALDPLHEPAHQTLMRLYAATGQQAAALRQYQLCVQTLADELGAPPADETTALYEQIRTGQRSLKPETRGNRAPAAVAESSNHRPALPHHAAAPLPPNVRYDWREAPTVEQIYGRERERQQLTAWLVGERCRLVSILGIGGLGKTTLAAQVVQDLATSNEQSFTRILWRSLLNAPPLTELLPDLLHFLALPQSVTIPESLDKRLALLLDYLTQARCLLIFDNLESLMEAGERGGRFRPGYEGYGQLLDYLGRHAHQSCLLLTSREQPQDSRRLERSTTTVRAMALSGLSLQAGQELLHQQGLQGDPEAEIALIRRYSGHPLALMLVAETIAELYLGDLAAFLAEETLIFDDIRDVLDQHFARLSPLEQEIMTWLAIEREPVTAQELAENLLGPVNRSDYLEALRALQRRMLLQSFADGFGLQNVVTEYTTNRFVNQLCHELAEDKLETFNRYPLLKASAKEYVRESQRRLILNPLTERLVAQLGRTTLLQKLRGFPNPLRTTMSRGYAGGNILNWLLDLEGELGHVDLSGLTIWQAYLGGKILHDLDLRGVVFKATVFTDTFDMLRCVAFSPDGALLAVGTDQGQLRFWRTADWQPVQIWKVSHDFVRSIAFSPDSQTIATADTAGLIHLWDLMNLAAADRPQARQTFTGHTSAIWSICFSPDGRLLASGSLDHTVRLWHVKTGQTIRVVPPRQAEVGSVCFSPNGQLLASGDSAGTILLTNVHSGLTARILQGHTHEIWSLCFTPDGQTLASGSADGTIRLWNPTTGQSRQTLTGHASFVQAVCFSPDGRTFVSADMAGRIRLWEPSNFPAVNHFQARQTLTGHTDQIWSICVSPDGRILASVSFDQSIRLWDISAATALNKVEGPNTSMANSTQLVSGHTLQTFQGYRRCVRAICYSADGKMVASGGTDGVIHLWDAQSDGNQPLRTLAEHRALVSTLSFSPDGHTLASGDLTEFIHLWDLSQPGNDPVQTFKCTNTSFFSICFSPDGQILAGGTTDRAIHFWDVATGQVIRTLTGHRNAITAICFSPDGQRLASSNMDPTILLWAVARGQILQHFQCRLGRVLSVAFSPDGQILASAGDEGIIYLWDTAGTSDEPHQTLVGHIDGIASVAFSPDGRLLASGGIDRSIRVWDVATGQMIHTLIGHTDRVRAVCFSPAPKGLPQTLASGGDDGAVKFWDVQSGRCLSTRRPDRPYERTKISGVTGLTPAQISALKELGALDQEP